MDQAPRSVTGKELRQVEGGEESGSRQSYKASYLLLTESLHNVIMFYCHQMSLCLSSKFSLEAPVFILTNIKGIDVSDQKNLVSEVLSRASGFADSSLSTPTITLRLMVSACSKWSAARAALVTNPDCSSLFSGEIHPNTSPRPATSQG